MDGWTGKDSCLVERKNWWKTGQTEIWIKGRTDGPETEGYRGKKTGQTDGKIKSVDGQMKRKKWTNNVGTMERMTDNEWID